jgi:hypothetical protein
VIRIKLNDLYKEKNNLGVVPCSSGEVNTLAWKTCKIVMENQIYYFEATLRSIPSQQFFTLETSLYNPSLAGKYNFTATLKKSEVLYL